MSACTFPVLAGGAEGTHVTNIDGYAWGGCRRLMGKFTVLVGTGEVEFAGSIGGKGICLLL